MIMIMIMIMMIMINDYHADQNTTIIAQVERTPLHTPSSPPLSCYAVAAPLLSSDDEDEEDDEDEDEEDEDENEKFVEESEADPMSRWAFLFSTELMQKLVFFNV